MEVPNIFENWTIHNPPTPEAHAAWRAYLAESVKSNLVVNPTDTGIMEVKESTNDQES